MYLSGIGVPKDITVSMKHLNKAANMNWPAALYLLGRIYEDGDYGIPKDYLKAFGYYQKAINVGHGESALSVALMYQEGRGVPKDENKYFEFLKRAANLGSQTANMLLGVSGR